MPEIVEPVRNLNDSAGDSGADKGLPWWQLPSRQWTECLRRHEEQVFLVLALLIGAIVKLVADGATHLDLRITGVVTLQDQLHFYGFAEAERLGWACVRSGVARFEGYPSWVFLPKMVEPMESTTVANFEAAEERARTTGNSGS
jgi:hypothetical protein